MQTIKTVDIAVNKKCELAKSYAIYLIDKYLDINKSSFPLMQTTISGNHCKYNAYLSI
ncbi:hypothetical protein KDAU_33330 [Dictyobacter aurantiacus]|uniref:Uncharacterized protein n=1 Tax=Dictyobacter aurantiacus TaxID=1936993 RepID=A0A401ZGJ0_9CHLR|nr:hypothetical protein KDAU_33330 [Dictyobacter aurantiacus]